MTNAELIAALRRCSYMTVADEMNDGYCKPCAYYQEDSADVTCIDRMMIDAADALEAADKRIAELEKQHGNQLTRNIMLTAQIPKEGEWIDGDARHVTARCSVCRRLRLGNGAEWANKYVRFCENCGARMKGEDK